MSVVLWTVQPLGVTSKRARDVALTLLGEQTDSQKLTSPSFAVHKTAPID